jgi:hypothetical protein
LPETVAAGTTAPEDWAMGQMGRWARWSQQQLGPAAAATAQCSYPIRGAAQMQLQLEASTVGYIQNCTVQHGCEMWGAIFWGGRRFLLLSTAEAAETVASVSFTAN